MPFTFSHPVLVLPLGYLNKRWVSITGLFLGSITPDFEYFFRMKKVLANISHTIPSIFYFTLPVALLLSILFHHVVRNPLIFNLPKFCTARIVQYTQFNWKAHLREHFFVVVVSIVVGAASHLAWDWMLHRFIEGGMQKLESHQQYLAEYRVQHVIHSIIGLALLSLAFYFRPRQPVPNTGSNKLQYWSMVSIFAAVGVLLRYVAGSKLFFDDWIVVLISTTMCGLVVASLVQTKFLK